MRRATFALPAICALACARPPAPVPPGPAVQRDATPVSASYGRTWDAVIEHFARSNISIRTIERASGLVVAEGASVDSADALRWADCGQASALVPAPRRRGGFVYALRPRAAQAAVYNFLVRGDSSASTVRATVRWYRPAHAEVYGRTLAAVAAVDCSTRGTWEAQAEADIRARAEATARGR